MSVESVDRYEGVPFPQLPVLKAELDQRERYLRYLTTPRGPFGSTAASGDSIGLHREIERTKAEIYTTWCAITLEECQGGRP